jgi:acyl carrier protein
MTPNEVAQLMQEIVGLDDVGLDADFFEFGGNSFLLLTLMAQIQDRTGIMLRLLDIVQEPTANGVSALLADHAVKAVAAGDE